MRLLLPARCDMPLVRLLGHSYYGTLLRAGIEICEIEHEILHAKVMLFDGVRAVIGSANLDQRSFHRNFELNLIIEDKPLGRQIQAMFREDFRDARRISLHDHERRGILGQGIREGVRPLQPLSLDFLPVVAPAVANSDFCMHDSDIVTDCYTCNRMIS